MFSDWAEILSKKDNPNGSSVYYVHYDDCKFHFTISEKKVGIVILIFLFYASVNKRLDEWVTEDRMDMSRLELPQKDVKGNTPLKLTNGNQHRSDSRPPSPEKECHMV